MSTNQIEKEVRVRIAPSPTGIPHIGNTRTALFNYLFAHHNHGTFILRIEDTDQARLVPESLDAIYEILTWLELPWDEKYVQSERLKIYTQYAQELLDKKLAYTDEGAIRFTMPKVGQTSWIEAVGNKQVTFDNKTQEDFVIIKSDGYPTYNFANVIDDHLMKISHVFRGYEFISSTPKHIQLYQAFHWEPPVFVHLPVILGADHQKLSKRHGAKSALDYRQEGYLKDALVNFMVLLGWNPGGDKEILTIDEMISLFSLEGINSASPIFDLQKLEWMNGMYIRNLELSRLKDELKKQAAILHETVNFSDPMIDSFIALAQTRMKTLNDFFQLILPYMNDITPNYTEHDKKIAAKLYTAFKDLSSWETESILQVMRNILPEENIKMSQIYTILTGQSKGLPLPQSLVIFGKENTLKRLHAV